MAGRFMERLTAAVLDCRLTPEARRLVDRAIVDTLAVAAAGFADAAATRAETVFAGSGLRSWSGRACESIEAAITVNGTAAHALDFDDLCLQAGHQSAVLVPALLSGDWTDPQALAEAYAAGLLTARAVSRHVGRSNLHLGWHGTGVYGALAAAAAQARLRGLDAKQLRHALALAAAQAGGLQLNFGTMAKPAHAGFAAAAGFRAARLAEAGMDAADDVFAARGFADLYGDGDGEALPADEFFRVCPDLNGVKLYPCCIAAHRMIAAALEARRKLGAEVFFDPAVTAEIVVPAGTMKAMRYDRATTGLEGKFSMRYTLSIVLMEGAPRIEHFEDETVARSDLRAAGERITVSEDGSDASRNTHETGSVRLTLRRSQEQIGVFEQAALPGSLKDPPTADQIRLKVADCRAAFRHARGAEFEPLARAGKIPEWAAWIG
jgi:2-methylcitrate dehydratase PrpD